MSSSLSPLSEDHEIHFVDNAAYGIDDPKPLVMGSVGRFINVVETNYNIERQIAVEGHLSVGLLTHRVVEGIGESFCRL